LASMLDYRTPPPPPDPRELRRDIVKGVSIGVVAILVPIVLLAVGAVVVLVLATMKRTTVSKQPAEDFSSTLQFIGCQSRVRPREACVLRTAAGPDGSGYDWYLGVYSPDQAAALKTELLGLFLKQRPALPVTDENSVEAGAPSWWHPKGDVDLVAYNLGGRGAWWVGVSVSTGRVYVRQWH
jgi:hypothetical protein